MLIILIIISLSIGAGTFVYLSNRVVMNDENATGNTAGNLMNGGLFCENDGKIYFSNYKDQGALYVMDSNMKNCKKLYEDNVSYINATNKYLIYVRDNHKRNTAPGQFFNFNTLGLYRLNKKDGKDMQQLYGKAVGFAALHGNYVYYQHYDPNDNLRFHKIKINGKEDIELSTEQIVPASFSDNTLYYNGVDTEHEIHAMNLDSNSSSTLYEGNCFNVTSTSDSLYFLSLNNNYAIGRVDLHGDNPQIIVEERCSFFNISPDEGYLYYQVDGGDDNRFCRMNLSNYKSETLMKGDFNSIHVTDHYVFFRKYDTNEFFYLETATGRIALFQPKVLK
ncbi:MAG: DUF5050 domain-containing protein [Acetivibrio sp.]